ncbi:MAG TPA: tRNA pseudouridine(38-40) synthase TruA [bacterium]|nr:tRNA pseudouridine(38-40) synthase TruA [bacterium]
MTFPDEHTTQRNIRLDLRYDGTDFCGWQMQDNQRSVEGVLLKAIHNILPDLPCLHAAGRTDAGVHAEHQVAQFFSDTQLTTDALHRAVNYYLPPDVAVTSFSDVPPNWDARRHARRRTYRYSILNSRQRDPLIRRTTVSIYRPLNISAMQEAAQIFVGLHDFSAFRSTHCEARNPVRRITGAVLLQETDCLHFWIEGHAFLRHMVRTIVGTLIEVGLGRLSPQDVQGILESRDRSRAGKTAPAHGLTLVRITYPGEIPPLERMGYAEAD